MVIAPRLTKAHASLHIVTTPPGAQVSLDKKLLGETPLKLDDLDEVSGGELVISRAGFDPIKKKVDLVIGRTTDVDETLKASRRRFGTIKVVLVGGGWGDVYVRGARIGRAPGTLKLPSGRQTLHLKNTGRTPAIEWDVTCDVDDAAGQELRDQGPALVVKSSVA